LEEKHPNACLTLTTQQVWGLKQFPYQRAVAKWSTGKKRRPALFGKQQQQQQPIAIFDSNNKQM